MAEELIEILQATAPTLATKLTKERLDFLRQIKATEAVCDVQAHRLAELCRAAREAGTKLDILERRLAAAEKVCEYASWKSRCPCCEEERECHKDCTFREDSAEGYEEMCLARDALAAWRKLAEEESDG